MIFQGGMLLLAVGIIQVLAGANVIQLVGIAAYFLVGIILINFFTSLLIVLFLHRAILKITIPQFVIFALVIVLQLLSLPRPT